MHADVVTAVRVQVQGCAIQQRGVGWGWARLPRILFVFLSLN